MNAPRPISFVPFTHPRRADGKPIAASAERPERDFGIGYGRSSGYATTRRYASNWAPPRFRCA